MNRSETQPVYYYYSFTFKDGTKKEFTAKADSVSLNIISEPNTPHSDWTLVKNFRCPNCPNSFNDNDYCPVAVNLEEIIKFFSNSVSYERVFVEVRTETRTFTQSSSLQESVSGLIGIVMVTSGCPIMGKLKPMVRFHLPFAGLMETEFRAMSMYLLGQYLLYKKGRNPDWDMKGLVKIYEDIKILNKNVVQRIANIEKYDTGINSLIVLNNFADYVSVSISDEILDEIEILYKDYF